MPLWLLTAWPWIKRFGPYAAAIAALLLGWHMLAVHYRTEGRAESSKAISAITQQRDSWITAYNKEHANNESLKASLAKQNADAKALADAYDKSKAQDALNVAASNKRWEQTQRVLSGLQQVIGEDGGCKVDQRNVEALKEL